ncbi:MAG: Crp/Fnr family transcriptional regulator [Armatimonadota bacterium]
MAENINIDVQAVLRKSGFFGRVSDDLLQKVTRMSKVIRYNKGELIFAEDTPCNGMYIVASGAVKVYKIGADGREHVLHVSEYGESFGEVALFLGSKGYPAYSSAVQNSDVIFIPKQPMLDLLENEPHVCTQVLGSLAMWTHRMVSKLEFLTLKDASSRLAGYILDRTVEVGSGKSDFNLSIPKQTLASQLAITSETLSRLLNRFEAQNLIEFEGRHITVTDREGLQEIADLGAADV